MRRDSDYNQIEYESHVHRAESLIDKAEEVVESRGGVIDFTNQKHVMAICALASAHMQLADYYRRGTV